MGRLQSSLTENEKKFRESLHKRQKAAEQLGEEKGLWETERFGLMKRHTAETQAKEKELASRAEMIDGMKANMQQQRMKMSDAYDRVQKVTSSERRMDQDLRAANALVQQRASEIQQLGRVSGEQHMQLKSFQAQVAALKSELIKERSVNRDVSMPVPVDPGPSAIFKPLQWQQGGGKLPAKEGLS